MTNVRPKAEMNREIASAPEKVRQTFVVYSIIFIGF